jgi:hypothetical protein
MLKILRDIQRRPEIFSEILWRKKGGSPEQKSTERIKDIFPPVYPEPFFLYP